MTSLATLKNATSSKKKIAAMSEGGKKLGQIRNQLRDFAQTEFDLATIDHYAQELIEKAGGRPSFKMVPGYSWSTCINLNDGIVHGIPQGVAKPGDLMTIDVGMYYQGYHTDTATSFVLGHSEPETEKFLKAGQAALRRAINQARAGKRIIDISASIQNDIEAAGYSVVRQLTGHGVGEELHDEPAIPCFADSGKEAQTPLFSGMTLAIEVMYVAGNWPLVTDQDSWTMRTKDGSLSAVFEETVLVQDTKPVVLTHF